MAECFDSDSMATVSFWAVKSLQSGKGVAVTEGYSRTAIEYNGIVLAEDDEHLQDFQEYMD